MISACNDLRNETLHLILCDLFEETSLFLLANSIGRISAHWYILIKPLYTDLIRV